MQATRLARVCVEEAFKVSSRFGSYLSLDWLALLLTY
jgi:hypothetical protein